MKTPDSIGVEGGGRSERIHEKDVEASTQRLRIDTCRSALGATGSGPFCRVCEMFIVGEVLEENSSVGPNRMIYWLEFDAGIWNPEQSDKKSLNYKQKKTHVS